jgi:hypothetical protein
MKPGSGQQQRLNMKTINVRNLMASALAVAAFTSVPAVRADEVTDWNDHMLAAIRTGGVGAAPASRITAMVQSAVFDAVNGVYQRYTPVHVPAEAAAGASARAAAVQAAYGVLVKQFSGQQTTLNGWRTQSLAALDEDGDGVLGQSVERGLAWGQHVADEIWAWRSVDGFSTALPPYRGSTEEGAWRPTPTAFLPGATPQLATTVPFVIDSAANFLPVGPNALGSPAYEAEMAEVVLMGRKDGVSRTDDQTLLSVFWSGNTPGFWNRAAVEVIERHDLSLLEKARVLAAMNIAVIDSVISCWNAKYTYEFWRPVTAIQITDPSWLPLITTPNHPEYPSGHSSQSGAAAFVLGAFFGDATEFGLISETTPGVTRYYSTFTQAAEEAGDARVFGGIHFRKSCVDAKAMGEQIASYVLTHGFQRVSGK